MGNQQKEGIHYQLGELYAPVMKAAVVQLFVAIAAKNSLRINLFKSDTKQAFQNGDIGEKKYMSAHQIGGLSMFRTDMR
jgi:hypothetical protein